MRREPHLTSAGIHISSVLREQILLTPVFRTALSLVAIFLVIGCSKPDAQPAGPLVLAGAPAENSTPTMAAEMMRKSLLLESGENATWSLYVPKGYKSSEPAPLVLALHFGGRPQPGYGDAILNSLVIPGLGDLNAIMVAPVSIDGGWETENNQEAIFKILDLVEAEYSIDSQRIIVTGFSMGGRGTWVTAAANQERFSCAIPVAGRPPGDDVSWTIPLYVINSKADEVIPFDAAAEYVEQIEQAGANVTFHEVEDLPHFQTGRFATPLKEAVPWVREVWGNEKQDARDRN